MSCIERAIMIAATAHAGQVDKAGQPYILHPIRVMMQMETEEERIVAVLHDVIEDSGTTLDQLRYWFPLNITVVVDRLTRRENEKYRDYIQRVGGDPIARKVKLADLADNTAVGRYEILPASLLRRYNEAIAALHTEWPRPD